MSAIFAHRLIGLLASLDTTAICPQDVKESAYKGKMRPVLEYGSSVTGTPKYTSSK